MPCGVRARSCPAGGGGGGGCGAIGSSATFFGWPPRRDSATVRPASREGTRMLARASMIATVLAVGIASSARAAPFVEFESGQVRPLALSPDHTRLFAVNTPDGRLEIFSID